MTEEECKRHGLPKGSLWLDEEAAKSVPHPLFDPGRSHISWDELPTGINEAIATSGNYQPTRSNAHWGQIPESDSQPRPMSIGNDEGHNQLISLQHMFGGSGRLGNLPVTVLAGMASKQSDPLPGDYSADNLLNLNNEHSRMMSGLHGNPLSYFSGNGSNNTAYDAGQGSMTLQQQAHNVFGTPSTNSMPSTHMPQQQGWVGGGPGSSAFGGAAPQSPVPISQMAAGMGMGGAGMGAGMMGYGGANYGGGGGSGGGYGGFSSG